MKINERTNIEKHGERAEFTEDDGETWTMLPEEERSIYEHVGIYCKHSERTGGTLCRISGQEPYQQTLKMRILPSICCRRITAGENSRCNGIKVR